MDYEHSLKIVQEELRHEREMRQLHGTRLDAVQTLAERTTENLHELADMVRSLALHQDALGVKIDVLVTALIVNRKNGGSQPQ